MSRRRSPRRRRSAGPGADRLAAEVPIACLTLRGVAAALEAEGTSRGAIIVALRLVREQLSVEAGGVDERTDE